MGVPGITFMLLLFMTFSVQSVLIGPWKRTTLNNTDFAINEQFSLSMDGIRIRKAPSMRRWETSSRSSHEPLNSTKTSLNDARKTNSMVTLLEWKKNYVEQNREYLAQGGESHACVIRQDTMRRRCCLEKVRSESHNESIHEKVMYCEWFATTYFLNSMRDSLYLYDDENNELEAKLKLIEHQTSQPRNGGSLRIITDLNSNVATEDVSRHRARRRNRRCRKRDWRRRNRRRVQTCIRERKQIMQERLTLFLVELKKIELLLISETVEETEQEDLTFFQISAYLYFMRRVADAYFSNRLGTFYHGVDKEWMVCGVVKVDKTRAISSYCTPLALVDPEAAELDREPLFEWESGRSMMTALEGNVPFSARMDRMKWTMIRQRGHYTYVNLFGDGICAGLDLARACHAFCCDTYFAFSYFCRTRGLSCVG